MTARKKKEPEKPEPAAGTRIDPGLDSRLAYCVGCGHRHTPMFYGTTETHAFDRGGWLCGHCWSKYHVDVYERECPHCGRLPDDAPLW